MKELWVDYLRFIKGFYLQLVSLSCISSLLSLADIYVEFVGGYLNEHGILNVKRLQLVLDELTVFETEHFEHEFADTNWFKGKQVKSAPNMDKARSKGKLGEWSIFVSLGDVLNLSF